MSCQVTVNFNGRSFSLPFSPSWTIHRLKNEIARHQGTRASGLKIIFAGRELPDALSLQSCDMNHSVIHAVVMSGQIRSDAEVAESLSSTLTLNDVTLQSDESVDDSGNQASERAGCFFVYCKSCKKLCQGKLRCRCSLCKEGSFVLAQGPDRWEDVLVRGRILGRCESGKGCQQATAEFYFKCAECTGLDEQAPLPMVKSNVHNIPCLTCEDVAEKLLVFPCESKHTMCLDCFQQYCVTLLDSRSFVQTETKGYTIPCPGIPESCHLAYIEEPHHFRLLGNEQYERYQKFATEECVLSGQGVLCPGRGCGEGILPPPCTRRIVCENGCGLVFCRNCLREFHNGPCQQPEATASSTGRTENNRFEVSPRSDQLSRWEHDSQNLIRATTKRCPGRNCGVRVEKNAGCNHMSCSRCRFEWCWICCIAWNRRCQSEHWFRQ